MSSLFIAWFRLCLTIGSNWGRCIEQFVRGHQGQVHHIANVQVENPIFLTAIVRRRISLSPETSNLIWCCIVLVKEMMSDTKYVSHVDLKSLGCLRNLQWLNLLLSVESQYQILRIRVFLVHKPKFDVFLERFDLGDEFTQYGIGLLNDVRKNFDWLLHVEGLSREIWGFEVFGGCLIGNHLIFTFIVAWGGLDWLLGIPGVLILQWWRLYFKWTCSK